MTMNDAFLARLIESGANGYAGFATSRLLETGPPLEGRYGPDPFRTWKAQIQQWLLELAIALETGQPAVFESRVRWVRKAFEARDEPLADLGQALGAVGETLREKLAGGTSERLEALIDGARKIATGPIAVEDAGLDPQRPNDRLALEYLEAVLGGDARRAIEHVVGAVERGLPYRDAYLEVLFPALREVGRMWHLSELGISEEHFVTATTQRAMTVLAARAERAPENGKTVVAASIAGNLHDLGTRTVTDFFDVAGWRAIGLGPDVPAADIARAAQYWDADLVVVSAVLAVQLRDVRDAVERVHAIEGRDVKVLVGGQAFAPSRELWKHVEADGFAGGLGEAVEAGTALLPT